MKTAVIIFDFDGVILESVDTKTDAFRELFLFVPEHVDEIVDYHLKNGGMSRYDKFKYIYANILHSELTEDQFNYLCIQFGKLVIKKVLKSPFVPGVHDFLKKNFHNFSFFIVSATPEDELLQIVTEKKLASFFKGIYGSPTKKIDHINTIIDRTRINKEHVLFIGDALNDLIAAKTTGIRFIGRILPEKPDYFNGIDGVEFTIRTFFELDHYFKCNQKL